MSAELAALWDELLQRVEPRIPDASFDIWVRPSRPIAFYEDLIVLGAPNDLAKVRLETHYLDILQDALRALLGRDMRLSVVLPNGSAAFTAAHVPPDAASAPSPAAVAPAVAATAAANYPPSPPLDSPFKPLNPRYTFDTFVVGNSNRFAHAATLAVAETPARAYNPLFVYGGVGLGKTHLMHALGHYVIGQNRSARVAYVSTETFTNEFINCLRDNKTVEFQTRYRHVDVLLIDDIQFLQGKERTQEEFYHTFNAIYEANKQIVISSDRPPKDIPTLEERLRSRFEWGLICDIQPPDLETRIAILRKKATHEKLPADDETLAFIAARFDTNIRELEGALNRVIAYAKSESIPVCQETAAMALKEILPAARPRPVTIETIIKAVAEYYGVRPDEFRARKRTRAVAFPRQVAMYLARELTDLSLPKIGEEFGGRDHTTVIHACDKISTDTGTDPSLQAAIRELKEKIKSG